MKDSRYWKSGAKPDEPPPPTLSQHVSEELKLRGVKTEPLEGGGVVTSTIRGLEVCWVV